MTGEEVMFRVRNPGPLADYTARHPGVGLSLWCNWECEVVEVSGADGSQVAEIDALLRERSPWTEPYALDGGSHAIVLRCVGLPHDDVYELIDAERCLHVPPMRFDGGWEVYSLVSFDQARVRSLFRRLKEKGLEVELLARRPLEVQPLLNTRQAGPNAAFAGLTERQMEALLLAFRHGMYQSPRRTTAAAIAEANGLSRSTYEEHLRKAENRIIANLAPYLEFYVKARKGVPGGPPKRASEATVWGSPGGGGPAGAPPKAAPKD